MERRNGLEITAEILRIARKGAGKTHIVYQANLNHAILEQHLNRLEEQGLVARKNGSGARVTIETTHKGLQFIEQFRSLQALAAV